MKRIRTRWAWCILIGLVLLTIVGCQSKAIQENIGTSGDSAAMVAEPIGYRAIAASPGSTAEKARRAVNTMSTSDKIGQLLMIELEGKSVTDQQRDILRTYRVVWFSITKTWIRNNKCVLSQKTCKKLPMCRV